MYGDRLIVVTPARKFCKECIECVVLCCVAGPMQMIESDDDGKEDEFVFVTDDDKTGI